MTPKEKAKELIDNFKEEYRWAEFYLNTDCSENAKQCALICVDEVLKGSPSRTYWETYDDETPSAITYWKEVKQEIENL